MIVTLKCSFGVAQKSSRSCVGEVEPSLCPSLLDTRSTSTETGRGTLVQVTAAAGFGVLVADEKARETTFAAITRWNGDAAGT